MEAKERLENAIPEYPELSTVRQQAIIDLAGMLKEYHEEKADHLVTITGVFADLISAALSSVDWYEIAEAYIEDNEEWTTCQDKKTGKLWTVKRKGT